MVLTNTVISTCLLMLNYGLSNNEAQERENPSPFECGFEPMSSSRLPLSLHFFVIAVVFLIFDVEITIILPFSQTLSLLNLVPVFFLNSVFLFILLLGLYAEWGQGALEWIL